MLRNLLLLVEPTPSGQVAKRVACEIAAGGDCNLTALQIHDTDRLVDPDEAERSPRELLNEWAQQRGGSAGSDMVTEAVADKHQDEYADLNITYQEKVLSGPKYTLLCQESEHNDLTVLGREGNLAEERKEDAKEVINLMLAYRSKPLIVTPPEPARGEDVLITYDGTPGSTRAVQLFVAMGLPDGRRIHALSLHRKPKVAEAHADSLMRYLDTHGLEAVRLASDTSLEPQTAIVDQIRETGSSMVVVGAHCRSGWRRSLFGSVTDCLVYHSPVPVFTCQ